MADLSKIFLFVLIVSATAFEAKKSAKRRHGARSFLGGLFGNSNGSPSNPQGQNSWYRYPGTNQGGGYATDYNARPIGPIIINPASLGLTQGGGYPPMQSGNTQGAGYPNNYKVHPIGPIIINPASLGTTQGGRYPPVMGNSQSGRYPSRYPGTIQGGGYPSRYPGTMQGGGYPPRYPGTMPGGGYPMRYPGSDHLMQTVPSSGGYQYSSRNANRAKQQEDSSTDDSLDNNEAYAYN